MTRTSSQGFTLIEVLVAVAILAIALAATVRAASISTDGAIEVKERILASWIAQNRLATYAATGAFPGTGTSQGSAEQAGINFNWRETVSATPNPFFRRVEVKVYAPRRPDYALASLIGYANRIP